jgi:hypothetical protein
MATAASMPKMTSTAMISIRVKPDCLFDLLPLMFPPRVCVAFLNLFAVSVLTGGTQVSKPDAKFQAWANSPE